MKYKVVYFTRTGNCKRIAEKISSKLSCEMIQVLDNKKWTGFAGFMKGGYYSSLNKKVEITTSKKIEDYDELVVISPLWAGDIQPSIRMLLKTIPSNKINLVLRSGGSILKKTQNYKTLTNIVEKQNNEDEIIEKFVTNLLLQRDKVK